MTMADRRRAKLLRRQKEWGVALDAATYATRCPFCGAKPGAACVSRPTTRRAPVVLHSPQAHMMRRRLAYKVVGPCPVWRGYD